MTTSRPYSDFLTKMQQPVAAPLLRLMKQLARHVLSSDEPAEALAGAVQTFFSETETAMAEHELWRSCGPEELERTCDCVERYVMSKLHDRVFATDADDLQHDKALAARFRELHFLTVEHLGISPEFTVQQPWEWAQQELRKMGSYRTPRDKMVCVLNCCKRINAALSHASGGQHGADEFFPVLVFVVLQAA